MDLRWDDLTVKPYGETGLLLEIQDSSLLDANQRVEALYHHLQAVKIPGVLHCLPAISSLTVFFNVFTTDAGKVTERIREIAALPVAIKKESRLIRIPVCFSQEFCPDLPGILEQKNLDREDFLAIFLEKPYRVFSAGFKPGFFYLGELDPAVQTARKTVPRTVVPASSLAIAGGFTGIYPSAGPGGWQIIGRAGSLLRQIVTYDLKLQTGDQVTFYPVSPRKLSELDRQKW